ncbi:hypothetical protein [Rheinheimera soli]|uniref:Uncharacterized protein n=1 Tax=Rheinheimera soli TaxID=443616 RepID=A0ABU1W4G0_9GAMM|nr:hypothetical protein [Rheinheimera soli]MDR7122829.1 hypothetical protein [Rheinheimera soli]
MIDEKKFKEFAQEHQPHLIDCITHLRSISKTIEIYEYHKAEAYIRIKNLEPTNTQQKLMLVFELDASYLGRLSIQAHVQSAIHNSRALYDLFAQLLNKVRVCKIFCVSGCLS